MAFDKFYLIFFIVSVAKIFIFTSIDYHYHSNDELEQELLKYENDQCRDISRVYVIGSSVEGRPIYAIRLSEHISNLPPLIPRFGLVANIHGNEISGRESLLYLTRDLCKEYYAGNDTIRKLLREVDIHFIPSLNPDGYEMMVPRCRGLLGRFNKNNKDLNRDFRYGPIKNYSQMQPETIAASNWLIEQNFVIVANLHDGDSLISIPMDSDFGITPSGQPVLSKDHAFIMNISEEYVKRNSEMSKLGDCYGTLNKSIINGNEWYRIDGSIQDFTIVEANGLAITIEMECCKASPPELLEHIYLKSKESLINLAMQTTRGVKGIIKNPKTGPIENVQFRVKGYGKAVKTNENGEYWKSLMPGLYEAEICLPNSDKWHKVGNLQVLDGFESTIFFIDIEPLTP